MDQPPDPTHGRTDETLLKIAAHQLKQETTPFYQITEKQCPGNPHFLLQIDNINFINHLQPKIGVDRNALMLLQFEVRRFICLK
jgi:hypothetical protein